MADRFNLSTALLDVHLDAGRGARTALRFEGRSLSYAELAALVARTGHALRELGVGAHERVAMLLGDRPEFVATFLGAVRIGAVAVPLNTLLRPGETIELIRHCGAVALVAETALLGPLRGRLPEAADLRVVIAVGASAPDALSLEALHAAAPAKLAPADTTADDMCFWQYSSGTTGRPKAVVHRQIDYVPITDGYGRAVVGMTPDDVAFSASKLFFSYGLGSSLAFPLRYGATAVLHAPRAEPRAVFELVRRERPTLFYAVPTFYAQLLAAAEADGALADLTSVRLCVSAGEALPAALFERWRARFGHEILDGIGSTEVGYIFISNVPGRVRPGTSGEVVSPYEAKIVDSAGHPVPAGELGELWVRGPGTFAGYWGDPERTARTIRDGWVVTGDTYTVDADGYYRWAGRVDDMLKVGGMWVAPGVVEAAVTRHPAVLECAVVGHPDDDGLIKPAAYVVLRTGRTATADEIRSFVRDRIAPFMRPRWIHLVDDLPRTSTGKIQRFRLRERTEGTAEGVA